MLRVLRTTIFGAALCTLAGSASLAAPSEGHRFVRYYRGNNHRVRVTPHNVIAGKSSTQQHVAIHVQTLDGKHLGHIVYGDIKLLQRSGSSSLGALGERLAPSYEVRGKHTGSVIARWTPSKGLVLTTDLLREASHNVADARGPYGNFHAAGKSDMQRLDQALRTSGSKIELGEVNAYTYDPQANTRSSRHALVPDAHL
ncbi:MAG: hypothetical protein KC503_40450 [Myxococcales bacterium]|nr:hypothetical protein [Myxococcales bacterium]